MASIPLSGEIRLGNHFNDQFFYGSSLTAQLNMGDSKLSQQYSIGAITHGVAAGSWQEDTVPSGTTTQRSLSQYRGGTGTYPTTNTTSGTTADNGQDIALLGAGGSGSADGYIRGSNNLAGIAVSPGTIVIAQYANGSTTNNTAHNLVHDVGYLEPGNYKVSYSGGTYYEGTHYLIVRGYTSPHLSGSSSNYVYNARSVGWSGGWSATLGSLEISFTVNSTYPYVILDLETHNQSSGYLITSVNRKDSTTVRGGGSQIINPNIWRVS